MTDGSKVLIARLKGLGFTRGSQMKLYGEKFEVAGEPLVVTDDLVLVDAIDKRSRQLKRVRIPLPILKMAAERVACTPGNQQTLTHLSRRNAARVAYEAHLERDALLRRKNGIFTVRAISGQNSRSTSVPMSVASAVVPLIAVGVNP